MSAIGLESDRVKLAPYSVEWPALFAAEKARLYGAIGPHVIDIQHTGSTSIPGMPAKPIIDITIAVADFEVAVVCVALMQALGYEYMGENGIPRRHFFHLGEPRTHHVHMVEAMSDEWRKMTGFRDYLIARPETAAEYAALKRDLARQFPNDRDAYLYGKAPFIERILAEAWHS